MDWHDTGIWLAIGFSGTVFFGSRFFVQWIASERAGHSYIPMSFWWLSIAGSVALLAYAIHKRDPVFILSYAPNCVIYVRNIMLIRKKEGEKLRGAAPSDPTTGSHGESGAASVGRVATR